MKVTEAVVIVAGLIAVVVFVAYKYWTLGDRGAEYDLVVKRGDSLGDPVDPHSPTRLDLYSRPGAGRSSRPDPDA